MRNYLSYRFSVTLAKVNYHIHTDAIKESLIPEKVSNKQSSIIYASKADVLNTALFGMTAKQWRADNPSLKGYVRNFAPIEQLVVLSNMENTDALLIHQEITQSDRLVQLN